MEIHNPAGDTAVSSKRRRRRGKKATSQTVAQRDANLEASKIRGDCEIASNNLEMDLLKTVSTVQLRVGHPTMDGGLTEDSSRGKNRKRRKRIKKIQINDEVQSMDQENSMSNVQLTDKNLRQETDDGITENEGGQSTNQNKVDVKSTVSLAEGNVNAKRKRKRKKAKSKAGNNNEVERSVQHANQDMIDVEPVNLTEGNVNQSMGQSHSMSKLQPSNKKFRQENCDKLAENVDVQHTDQNKVDIESTVNPTEGNVSAKRKRKKKKIKKKAGTKDELQSMNQSNSVSNLHSHNSLGQETDDKVTGNEDVRIDQEKMDIESTYNLAEGNMSTKRKRRRKKAKSKSKDKNKDEVQSMDLANDISNLQLSNNNIGREIDGKVIENDRTAQESDFPARKEYIPCHSDVNFENVLNEVNNGISVVVGTTSLGPSGVKEAEFLSKDLGEYPSRPPTTTDRRKLLVLDVNGLLAYIVMPAPKGRKADTNILRRAVFKRPFCDDFLKFCFQNFDVGIWSSRAKEVIDRVVDYLLGYLKQKLLFCWNMSHSTQTGFKTLENIHKPLVFKELRKIWENDGSKFSWNKGQYDESNTLMIDDSPYKALLNPLHTAIFPHSYHYEDKDDNSLGPGGDLRVYLEGLLKSENVQEYVEHHPFGQSAINETNVSWQFYSGVLQNMSNKIQAGRKPTPVLTLSQNLTAPPGDKVVDLEHSDIAHSTAAPIKTIDTGSECLTIK